MSEGVARAQVLSPFLSRTSWLLSPPPLLFCFVLLGIVHYGVGVWGVSLKRAEISTLLLEVSFSPAFQGPGKEGLQGSSPKPQ